MSISDACRLVDEFNKITLYENPLDDRTIGGPENFIVTITSKDKEYKYAGYFNMGSLFYVNEKGVSRFISFDLFSDAFDIISDCFELLSFTFASKNEK